VLKSYAIGLSLLLSFTCGLGMAADSGAGQLSDDKYMRFDVCLGCHEAQYEAIRSTAHWMSGDDRTPVSAHQCASCHGNLDEHVEAEGEIAGSGMKAYGRASLMTPEEQTAVCAGCHKEASLMHWQGSGHDNADVGCVGCHSVHQPDRVRARETEAEVCFSCHADLRAQIHKPYGHPLREDKMGCSDCHGAHGGVGESGLKGFSVNEVCYECHAEKRGPFLWEHAPASENCVLCHSAHGSVHRGMLTRRQPQLCQSCHEPTHPRLNPGGPYGGHSRLALSYRAPGAFDQGPDPDPTRPGISRLVMGEACSNCHNQVHGTNHPAGANLMR